MKCLCTLWKHFFKNHNYSDEFWEWKTLPDCPWSNSQSKMKIFLKTCIPPTTNTKSARRHNWKFGTKKLHYNLHMKNSGRCDPYASCPVLFDNSASSQQHRYELLKQKRCTESNEDCSSGIVAVIERMQQFRFRPETKSNIREITTQMTITPSQSEMDTDHWEQLNTLSSSWKSKNTTTTVEQSEADNNQWGGQCSTRQCNKVHCRRNENGTEAVVYSPSDDRKITHMKATNKATAKWKWNINTVSERTAETKRRLLNFWQP